MIGNEDAATSSGVAARDQLAWLKDVAVGQHCDVEDAQAGIRPVGHPAFDNLLAILLAGQEQRDLKPEPIHKSAD
jgi:hypothetical protein